LDDFLLDLLGRAVGRAVLRPVERGGSVVKQILLPTVEDRGIELVLLTDLRDGFVLQQVKPEDFYFLLGRELSSCGHEHSLSK
jgi:hypothetical protein